MGWCLLCFFFFKQKTAYEMRISDWSSDVCSSDLFELGMRREQRHRGDGLREQLAHVGRIRPRAEHGLDAGFVLDAGATYAEVRKQEFGQPVGPRLKIRVNGRESCWERVC